MVEASDLILGAEKARMGGRLWISIEKHHPDCIHTVVFRLKNQEVAMVTDQTGSFLWEIPDFTELCPDSRIVECLVLCRTYLRGQFLGERVRSFRMELPEPVKVLTDHLTLGTPTTIRLSPRPKGYHLDLDLVVNNITFAIATGLRAEQTQWTGPYRIATEFPSAVRTRAIFRCTTWNGTEQMGITDASMLLEVPDNQETRPAFHSVTLSPVGEGLPEPFSKLYISGKTGVRATVDGVSLYSKLDTPILRVGPREVTGKDLCIPVLGVSGRVPVTVILRDQRGFQSTWENTLEIQPYQSPRIVPTGDFREVICERANAAGQLTPAGTYLAIRAGRRYSELFAGARPCNQCVLRYRIRRTEDAEFGPWITMLEPDSPEDGVSLLLPEAVKDSRRSYRVELSARDLLGQEHVLRYAIMTEAVSFVLYDGVDGAAFGKYPEEPHVVDLAPQMLLRVRGTMEVLGETWQELLLSSAVEEAAIPHGRHEASGCYLRISQGNRVSISFNCSFDYQDFMLQINAIPIPVELRPEQTVSSYCPTELGMALVSVEPDGYIYLEGLPYRGYAGWAEGWIEYFL